MRTDTLFAVIVAVVGVLAAVAVAFYAHESPQDDPWDDFADKANVYTDHVLETGTYHEPGHTDYISWSTLSARIGALDIKTTYSYQRYTTSYWTETTESLSYCYVFADDGCLRLEWHSMTNVDQTVPSDPSKNTHTYKEDHVARTQYIPYSAIEDMFAYEVSE